MATATVSIGSNIDPAANVRACVARLRERFQVTAVSPLYRTRPVDAEGQPDFVNGVVLLEFAGSARELLDHLREIEREFGREEKGGNRPRTIDLDVVLFDEEIIEEEGLVVPHPRMHERAFVLVPLCDVAPDLLHPTLRRTVRELTDALPDRNEAIRGRL